MKAKTLQLVATFGLIYFIFRIAGGIGTMLDIAGIVVLFLTFIAARIMEPR